QIAHRHVDAPVDVGQNGGRRLTIAAIEQIDDGRGRGRRRQTQQLVDERDDGGVDGDDGGIQRDPVSCLLGIASLAHRAQNGARRIPWRISLISRRRGRGASPPPGNPYQGRRENFLPRI